MKQELPQSSTKTITLFPSFFRFITEYSFTEQQGQNIKVFLASFLSVFLLGLIFLQGVVLFHQLDERKFLAVQRSQLQKEVQYWQQVADKYQGYRDVYYRIASLQYKLGNVEESQSYIKKALELDPNFPAGHVLGAKVGINTK